MTNIKKLILGLISLGVCSGFAAGDKSTTEKFVTNLVQTTKTELISYTDQQREVATTNAVAVAETKIAESKASLAEVARTGDYYDLRNLPDSLKNPLPIIAKAKDGTEIARYDGDQQVAIRAGDNITVSGTATEVIVSASQATVDEALSTSSTNAVQNKAVTTRINEVAASVTTEASARSTADGNLQTAITEEARARATADTENLTAARSYTDDARTALSTRITTDIAAERDARVAGDTAAKSYTDTEVAGLKTYVDTQDKGVSNNVLRLAKEYTDSKDPGSKSYVQEQIAAVSNNVIAIASSDATTKANAAQAAAEATANAKIGTISKDTVAASIEAAASSAKSGALEDAKAYTDMEVDGARLYAETKATLAKDEAVYEAAEDATSKADAAKSGAVSDAKTYTDTKVASLKTTVEGELAKKVDHVTTTTLTPEQQAKITFIDADGIDQDVAVQIGKDADALLPQAKLDAAPAGTVARSVGVAIGSRAKLGAAGNTTVQAIAIGFNAQANGTQAIAIGAGAQHLDETAMDGHAAYASGSQTIAIGYSAKATAENALAIGSSNGSSTNTYVAALAKNAISIGNAARSEAPGAIAIGAGAISRGQNAVQIGSGVNTQPNTLKFGNVTVIEEGKLVNTSLPQEVIPETNSIEECVMTFTEGHTYTMLPDFEMGPGCECAIIPNGTRNYTLYIPNEPNLRAGMPINIGSEVPAGIKTVFRNETVMNQLPAKVKIEQPYGKLVIISSETIDDGTDWTPIITNMCIVCTNTATDGVVPKFVTSGDHSLEGESLHSGTVFQIAYPTSATTVSTNNLVNASASGTIAGTFYHYTSKVELTPTSMLFTTVGTKLTSWFEIIYKTVNGSAEVKRYEVEFNL